MGHSVDTKHPRDNMVWNIMIVEGPPLCPGQHNNLPNKKRQGKQGHAKQF